MEFFVWDYLDFVRASQSNYADFRAVQTKRFGGDFPRCPQCRAEIGGLEWQAPFRVALPAQKQLGDLCTDGQDLLVSQRFQHAWAASGLTGIDFRMETVECSDRRAIEMGYKVLRIPFATVKLDEEASGVVINELVGCDVCRVASRTKVNRIRVDENSWNSLDVFFPSGLYGELLVTQRFVEFVSENSLTNFHFIHQDDYREPKTFEEPS